jgi:hypothetical protein
MVLVRIAAPGGKKKIEGLPVVLHNVAGISERHWVCASVAGGISREVAGFGATTPELIRMTKWLQACGEERWPWKVGKSMRLPRTRC